jgi:hypothetical protein
MQLVSFINLQKEYLQKANPIETTLITGDKQIINFSREKGYSVIDYKNEPLL